jgi:DNA mismatch repair protein MutL
MIKKLPKELVNQIAAGEVVERPASVVKELMENAIDAGSTEITVRIEEGGLSLITVTDNGIGIDKDNIELVFEQHATSKIHDLNDLFNINTLGFRGEALASIASVAESTRLVSRTKGSDDAVEALQTDGTVQVKNTGAHDKGTTVEVHNLFINVPARRKFLKSELTERKHIYSTFLATALPYLNIRFELYTDGKKSLLLSQTKDLSTRIFEAFGKETAKHMLSGNGEAFGMKIEGVIGDTHLGQKYNKNQYVYINNRYVRSPLIHQAIMNAYQGHMHRDLKPSYIIMINVDPEKVDVNIHPRKYEVKFEQEKEVFSAVRSFVSSIIAPKGNVIPSETPDIEEFVQTKQPRRTVSDHSNGYSKKIFSPQNSRRVNDAMSFTKSMYNLTSEQQGEESAYITHKTPFQIFNTYICYEEGNRINFIDQHAAAEKILFEKLLDTATGIKTKPLLVPQVINLDNTNEKEILLKQKEELSKLGFIIDDFGKSAVQVSEVPELSDIKDFDLIVSDLLKQSDELGIEYSEEIATDYGVTRSVYLKIATIACHGSIRAGQSLSIEEMKNIIKDISSLKTGQTCPHGRPIKWNLSKSEIERNFNRDI